MGARSDPFVTVRCPTCGVPRQTTQRTVRRLRQEGRTLDCNTCLRVKSVRPREGDLWFWLERYGVSRNGMSARDHIARHGIPHALRQLLDEVNGTDKRAAA